MLGGTLTYAGVNFSGLFFAWGKQIISGPCYDAVLETARLGGAKIPDYTAEKQSHDENRILINKHIYTYVIHKMCTDSGAMVICNSMISYIEETSDGVFAIITDKSGMKKIKAKTLVDATGDAIVNALYNKRDVELDVSAYVFIDRMFVPLRAVSEAFGKKITYDKSGLIVISGKDNFFSFRDDLHIFRKLCGELCFSNPDGEEIVQSITDTSHPRLLTDENGINRIKERIRTDEDMSLWFSNVKRQDA